MFFCDYGSNLFILVKQKVSYLTYLPDHDMIKFSPSREQLPPFQSYVWIFCCTYFFSENCKIQILLHFGLQYN